MFRFWEKSHSVINGANQNIITSPDYIFQVFHLFNYKSLLICNYYFLLLLFLRITDTGRFSSRRKMEKELCNLHETIRIIEEDIQTTR